jgi:hypothetical protein
MRFNAFLFLCVPGILHFNISEKEIQNAISTLKSNKPIIQKITDEYATDKAAVCSIVFPEVIRYNAFKDFIETKSLEWLYVQYGKDKADFSIGLFQMKPSFIEKLEATIECTPSVRNRFNVLLIDNQKDIVEKRRLRVERLKNIEWQLRYAVAYWCICEEVFKEENFDTKEAKIKFFATAYNFGFDRDVNKIKRWTTIKAFPYGEHYTGKQLIYSDLSIDFFKKYAQDIFN